MLAVQAQALSAAVEEQTLGLLQESAIYRSNVYRPELRHTHTATSDPDTRRGLLRDAINRATDGHGS